MKHSELPWKSHFYTHNEKPSHFWIQTEEVEGRSYVVAEVKCNKNPNLDNANADFIVKACNEYYSLKAKAELLDKAIMALQGVQPIIEHRYCRRVDNVLKKAKELK
jgi:hypothetical protein